jgi:hypothetical protein
VKTIFFGNGLNYLSENSISWKQLLDKIKGDNLFDSGKLPNTMIYERSIIGNPISFDTLTKKEGAIKKEIADMLRDFPSNVYYGMLAELNAENYLTTNYDYASLEYYINNKSCKVVNKSTEDIYSIRRYKEVVQDGKLRSRIWHIHGEIDVPPSIMLGLDQYCGSIGKIDDYVKGKYDFQKAGQFIKANSIISKLNGENSFDSISWIELFFNSTVHIIGFGLDFSEIDVWWILNKRARFKLDSNLRKAIKNKIYYYTTFKDSDKDEEKELIKSQNEMLRTLDVEVVPIKLNGTVTQYEDVYSQIFDLIRKA